MNLPPGVSFNRRRRSAWSSLIGYDPGALVQVPADEYAISERRFGSDVAPYLWDAWEEIDRYYGLKPTVVPAAPGLVGAAARPKRPGERPTITVVPNLETEATAGGPTFVFGCTMGHYPRDGATSARTWRVYEFQSHGLLALDREAGEIELWAAGPGEKVAIPTGSHYTLYNLGGLDEPLIALDYATPADQPDDISPLVRSAGPVLLAHYDGVAATFTLNRSYLSSRGRGAAPQSAQAGLPSDDLAARQVRIPLGFRLDLGPALHAWLATDADASYRFARLGIRVRRASPEVWIGPRDPDGPPGPSARSVAAPLLRAMRPGSPTHRYFFGEREVPPAIPNRDLAAEERRRRPVVPNRLQRLDRCLQVVVEGPGDWTVRAFRPVFAARAPSIRVIYVDDTGWTNGVRPPWTATLRPWESYLDKANSRDWAKYQNLRPDVVCVATPDRTHAAIASTWLDRAPLVLIEKPIDSSLANLDGLIGAWALGSGRRTQILGLDHYRFYALALRELLPTVTAHLGGAVREIAFWLAESQPIQDDRALTLQLGLTLDLAPHLLALLLFFGAGRSGGTRGLERLPGLLDEIRVRKLGRHDQLPALFTRETASWIEAVFEDYSGTGLPIPLTCVVGKGFTETVKYLHVVGINGNAIRIDFGSEDAAGWPVPQRLPNPYLPGVANDLTDMTVFADREYHRASLFFLQGEPLAAGTITVPDPYAPTGAARLLHIRTDLGWKRLRRQNECYEALFDSILFGGDTGLAGTMTLPEARQVMIALERVWRAVDRAQRDAGQYPVDGISAPDWAT